MSKRLVEQHEAALGEEIGGKLKTAVPATSGFGWPLYVGVAVGLALALVVSALVDQYGSALWYAIGGTLGVGIGLPLQDRAAQADDSPGDLFVVLGATEADLVVFQRSVWNTRPQGVGGRVPFSEVANIGTTRRLLGNIVIVIVHQDGTQWRYELARRQWGELRQTLPAAIDGAAA